MVAAAVMLISGSAATAAFATPAAAHKLTVVEAVVAQDRILSHSAGYKIVANLKHYTVAEYPKLAPKVAELKRIIDHAAVVVSHASATTTRQRTGRKDWVAGAHLTATGFSDLAVELEDAAKGDQAATLREASAGKKLLKAGAALASRGDRLLGLPTTA
jgi:hypothetical protein